MQAIHIRAATIQDVPTLAGWNIAMARETEDKALSIETVTAGVQAVLDDPRRGLYLIAEREGAAVGGLMLTYEWSDWRNGDFWWIQSVYVAPAARRSGVFRALYAQVQQRARAAGAVGLRLYVEKENRRAQTTYSDLGMQRCHYDMFETLFA